MNFKHLWYVMNNGNAFGFVFLEIKWGLSELKTQALRIKKETEKQMFLESLVGNAIGWC